MSWLTSAEAAEYARLSIYTIRAAAERGDLDGVKVTLTPKPPPRGAAPVVRDTDGRDRRAWRFRTEDVDAWLERGRVTGIRSPRRRRGAA